MKMVPGTHGTIFALTVSAGAMLAGAWQQSPGAPGVPPPGAPPMVRPPAKEKIVPPQEVYKPLKKESRNPETFDEPVTAPPPDPTVPAEFLSPPAPPALPPLAPSQQPIGPNGAPAAGPPTTAGPAMPIAPPTAVAPAAAPTPVSATELVVLGVLALVILVPLGLGLWWMMASRSSGDEAGARTP